MARRKSEDPETSGEANTEQSADEIRAQIETLQQQLRDQGEEIAEPEEGNSPPPGMVRMTDLSASLETLGKAILAQSPVQKVSMGRYEPRAPIHRRAKKKDVPKLTRMTFENGNIIREFQLTPEEILLYNQIVKGGRYIDRKVEIIIQLDGGVDGQPAMMVRYNPKRDAMDELREAVMRLWSEMEDQPPARTGLERMLQVIVAEQARKPKRQAEEDAA